MRLSILHASLLSLALPAAGWAIPGSGFGTMPGQALLDAVSCPDATALSECRLPSRAQIQEEMTDFLQWSEGRVETILNVASQLSTVAEEVRALAGDDPGAYRTFYLRCAQSISAAAQDQEVVDDLMLVGKESPMLKHFRDLGDVVRRYDAKIAGAPDRITIEALKMAKNAAMKMSLESLPNLVEELESVQGRYFKDAGREMLRKARFDASSLVNVDEGCETEEKLAFRTIVITRDAPWDLRVGFALIEDAAVLKAAFDGIPSHKGPLRFSCPRIFLLSPGARYDAGSHTVVNERGRYRSGARTVELIELLRSKLSR